MSPRFFFFLTPREAKKSSRSNCSSKLESWFVQTSCWDFVLNLHLSNALARLTTRTMCQLSVIIRLTNINTWETRRIRYFGTLIWRGQTEHIAQRNEISNDPLLNQPQMITFRGRKSWLLSFLCGLHWHRLIYLLPTSQALWKIDQKAWRGGKL